MHRVYSSPYPQISAHGDRGWLHSSEFDKFRLHRHGVANNFADARFNPEKYIKTDDVVNNVFNDGYDAVKLHDVYDGGYRYDGRIYVDTPIDETIINKGVPRLVLDLGENK
jgi:hypothetical protein